MILITGYKGFIGSFMLNKLKDSGYKVRGLELGDKLNLNDISTVIHLGGISSTTEKNVEKVLTQNYDFSKELLDICVKNNINFQYASSASVYGRGLDFSEDAPVSPLTPYAWSKYLFERYALKVAEQNCNISIQGFRYFNVWSKSGEDHKHGQASPYFKFFKDAKEKGAITLFENSKNYKRDFIHVSEIINYHIRFFKVAGSGIWNLGSGIAKSFEDVALEISYKQPCLINYVPMPDNLKESYQYFTCANMTKTNNTLKLIT